MQLVYDFHFWALFIAPAIIVSLDALTGFSGWAAAKLNGRIRDDAILLFEIVIAAGGVIWWFHHLDIPHHGFVDYIRWQDVQAQLARDKIAVAHAKEVAQIERVLWVIELALAVACVVMAKMQRRKLILWVPIAFLSNVGGIIWLTLNRSSKTLPGVAAKA